MSVLCVVGAVVIYRRVRSGGQWGNSMCAVRRQDFALIAVATHHSEVSPSSIAFHAAT